MYLDKNDPYTFKSQYLQNARLTGSKDSNLSGNDLNNILLGNEGNNSIDGKLGEDVVQFSGSSKEYTITKDANLITIEDSKSRDGKDTLVSIEILRFKDKDILVKDIK